MARKSKCNKCKKEITKEEKIIVSGKGYCENCNNEIKQEKEDYNLLLKTICDYFNIDKVTGLMFKQIKQYKDEFNYTNQGIGYTLWFLKEIKGKSFNETKYGIALVKYHHDEARRYFEQQQRISNSMNQTQETIIREVKVDLNKVYKKENDKFTINIEQLLGGE